MDMKSERQMFTMEHQDKLAEELAVKADIDVKSAQRVLEILHIGKLDENLVALHRVLDDTQAVNALGMAQDTARRTAETLGTEAITLDNLRIGLKPEGLSGIMV